MCASSSGFAAAFSSASGAALSQEAADGKTNVQSACAVNMVYEATCTLTTNLKMLSGALLTVRPTSTQKERHFFIRQEYVTKQSSRLLYRAVNAFCVLKFHFKKGKF
jgi:hypothetical protein